MLIIDGDDEGREKLAAELRDEYSVETAPTARMARFWLSAERFDVAVLDPVDPAVEGASIIAHIQGTPEKPEVVVLTHRDHLASSVDTLRAGAFEFVSKPADTCDLRKAIANAAQLRAFREQKIKIEKRNRTERHQLATLLAERSEQMQAVFENVPAMLYRIACTSLGDRRLKFVSPNCRQVIGRDEQDLLRRSDPFLELVHPEDAERFRKTQARADSFRDQFRFEGRFVLPSGKVRWFDCLAQPVVQGSGDIFWDGVMLDVTDRNELQSEAVLTDRLATVGTLAASVAHEVNNPLSYVSDSIRALREALASSSPALLQLVSEATDGLKRIESTVRDLRTFARSSDVRSGPVNVSQVLDASIRLASNEIRHRAQLIREYDKTLSVKAAESDLGQVFLNLLIASSHTLPVGNATLYTITARITREDSRVRIEVEDNGRGMSDMALRSSFDPFPSKQPSRAGVGLYVSQRIVAAMGGQISVSRAPEGGNRFAVVLPIALTGDETPVQARPGPRLVPDKPARILVVDDEDLVVTALVRALDGHQVTCARSGREAIQLLETSGPFDLILCDVMMPDMTGSDVYVAARQFEPGGERRIVFITGGAFTDEAHNFLMHVPNRRLEKPFSRDCIRELVANLDIKRQ